MHDAGRRMKNIEGESEMRMIMTLKAALPVLGLLVAPALAGEKQVVAKDGQNDWVAQMVSETKTHGWAGLEMEKIKGEDGAVHKLKVKSVAPKSPAAEAGIVAGDVVVAINGFPIEKVKSCKKDLIAGKQATYTIASAKDGQWEKKDIALTLTEPPRDVLAQWIGYQLLAKAESKKSPEGRAQASK
jgi:predicted metalloprotease with PDZ domain